MDLSTSLASRPAVDTAGVDQLTQAMGALDLQAKPAQFKAKFGPKGEALAIALPCFSLDLVGTVAEYVELDSEFIEKILAQDPEALKSLETSKECFQVAMNALFDDTCMSKVVKEKLHLQLVQIQNLTSGLHRLLYCIPVAGVSTKALSGVSVSTHSSFELLKLSQLFPNLEDLQLQGEFNGRVLYNERLDSRPKFEKLRRLDLQEANVAQGWNTIAMQLQALQEIACKNPDDKVFEALLRAKKLTHLTATKCDLLADSALVHVASMPALQVLTLTECANITPDGIAKLQSARPKLVVTWTLAKKAS